MVGVRPDERNPRDETDLSVGTDSELTVCLGGRGSEPVMAQTNRKTLGGVRVRTEREHDTQAPLTLTGPFQSRSLVPQLKDGHPTVRLSGVGTTEFWCRK